MKSDYNLDVSRLRQLENSSSLSNSQRNLLALRVPSTQTTPTGYYIRVIMVFLSIIRYTIYRVFRSGGDRPQPQPPTKGLVPPLNENFVPPTKED